MKPDCFKYFVSAIRGDSVTAHSETTPFDTFHAAWCEMQNIRDNDNSDLTQLQIVESRNNRYTHAWRFV